MIGPTGMVNTCMQMELHIKVIGKKTNSTVRVKRHGLMVLVMKETTKRVRNMEKVFSGGQMVVIILEIF